MSARIIINNGKLIRKKKTPKKTKHFVHGTQYNVCFSIIVSDNDNEYEIEKNQPLYKLNYFYFYSKLVSSGIKTIHSSCCQQKQWQII